MTVYTSINGLLFLCDLVIFSILWGASSMVWMRSFASSNMVLQVWSALPYTAALFPTFSLPFLLLTPIIRLCIKKQYLLTMTLTCNIDVRCTDSCGSAGFP
jgi:hypothetical protein